MKNLDYYKRLAYTLHREPIVDSDGSKYWIAEYLELVGCKTDGLTEAEAITNLQELFDDYIEARIESAVEIPEPAPAPSSIKEIWIFLPREQFHSSLSAVGEVVNTTETKREIKCEPISTNYSQIAA